MEGGVVHKHLNYANVVATLALLFAMSGGALAAQHYLLNSVSQINPRVLAKLRSAKPDTRYAVVSSHGEVVQSSPGVTATEKGATYLVNFHRHITGCATVASETNLPGKWAGGYVPQSANGAVSAWIPAGGTGELFVGVGAEFPPGETAEVTTDGAAGALENSAFSIMLVC